MSDVRPPCTAGLRLVVHDFSGHPFQVQLSRELARRCHVVDHQYCPSYVSGHGDMRRRSTDPGSLSITGISLRRPFDRYRPSVRLMQELEYSVKGFRAIRAARPDVTVLCNIPLIANCLLVALMRICRMSYVFWHQDVYSEAIKVSLQQRLPRPMSSVLGRTAETLERWITRRSAQVVAITSTFIDQYRRWKVSPDRYTVISNWAQVDLFRDVAPADRSWLGDRTVRRHLIMYSGTLGLKHDPALLLKLARSEELSDCTLVVVTEGKGRDWLAQRSGGVEEGRLILHDYLPFSALPNALASADLLVSILEPAASRFSVPSKVLTYMCAGRPVLAVMDPANAASKLLIENDAGVVLGPAGESRIDKVVRQLLDDPERMMRMGAAARAFAERSFDIQAIADRFERVLRRAAADA